MDCMTPSSSSLPNEMLIEKSPLNIVLAMEIWKLSETIGVCVCVCVCVYVLQSWLVGTAGLVASKTIQNWCLSACLICLLLHVCAAASETHVEKPLWTKQVLGKGGVGTTCFKVQIVLLMRTISDRIQVIQLIQLTQQKLQCENNHRALMHVDACRLLGRFFANTASRVAQFCTELSMQIAGSFQSLLQKELLWPAHQASCPFLLQDRDWSCSWIKSWRWIVGPTLYMSSSGKSTKTNQSAKVYLTTFFGESIMTGWRKYSTNIHVEIV